MSKVLKFRVENRLKILRNNLDISDLEAKLTEKEELMHLQRRQQELETKELEMENQPCL